jgi:uncharacterized protein (TIGR03663 family)
METETKQLSWLQKPIRSFIPEFNLEVLLITGILLLAIISRFAMLGERVMSHDEINHVIPSFELLEGKGYRHDPVTHGPFQFHVVALSYFMFGDNDFTSRIPAALFSIGAVGFVLFAFRRYLGRNGALLASILFLISPYMLFYGRYTRNEAFIELIGVMSLYAILRYLDKGDHFSLLLLTISTALHFTIKETAYIYTAQLLIFVFVLFIEQVLRDPWADVIKKKQFLYLILFVVIALSLALGMELWSSATAPAVETLSTTVTETASVLPETPINQNVWTMQRYASSIAIGLAAVAIFLSAYLILSAYGWKRIKEIRSFNILFLTGTLILPVLAAFPITVLGWNPLDYSETGLVRTGIVLAVMIAASAVLGILWDSKKWLIHAGIFWFLMIVFYTTFFTNGKGFFTGVIGSLGYWLSQHDVQRGGQPLYYYALIQVPLYEFLPALGMLMAVVIGFQKRLFSSIPGIAPSAQDDSMLQSDQRRVPTAALLIYWSIMSTLAYSFAGEKMPWLTVHIALPLILTAGWGIGHFLEKYDWAALSKPRGWQTFSLLIIAVFSAGALLTTLTQDILPFSGKDLTQLAATQDFLLASILFMLSLAAIFYLNMHQKQLAVAQSVLLIIIILLTVQTIRTSYRANFINYDNANEYLVYAHAAGGPKEVLSQIEEISRRITGGKNIGIAYDNDVNYPYWWYLRDYPNKLYYADQPTREVGQQPLIAAGDSTMSKLGPIIKNNYIEYSYMRLWWPNQDYWNINGERFMNIFRNRAILRGIVDIWLNRDYRAYAAATGSSTFTLESWEPSSKMKFYIRKDIAAQIWDYGIVPENIVEQVEDPYLGVSIDFWATSSFGSNGSQPGQFSAPRGMAIGPDHSLYVADSQNHRIQHFSAAGEFIESWGGFSGGEPQPAVGMFNEPWGIAVASDGSVYVTDTWNHRVQKFDAHGKFITSWGYFGQAETSDAFWGPRGVAVDRNGLVYIADTGNKRIAIFDANGKFINQFGTYGFNPGEFDEPVGVAVDELGDVYVTDTWNQRVQVFRADSPSEPYLLNRYWDVAAWYGQSLDNKPFLTVSPSGDLFVTDPEGPRILQFTNTGEIVRVWGDYSADLDGFGLASGIAVDEQGILFVSDGGKHRILRFDLSTLPE